MARHNDLFVGGDSPHFDARAGPTRALMRSDWLAAGVELEAEPAEVSADACRDADRVVDDPAREGDGISAPELDQVGAQVVANGGDEDLQGEGRPFVSFGRCLLNVTEVAPRATDSFQARLVGEGSEDLSQAEAGLLEGIRRRSVELARGCWREAGLGLMPGCKRPTVRS